MRHINTQGSGVLLASLLFSVLPLLAADEATTTKSSPAPTASSEIEQLKQMLAQQQKKDDQGTVSAAAEAAPANSFPNLGQVASTTGVLPPGQTAGIAPLAATFALDPQASSSVPAGPSVADLGRRVEAILRNLGGFRFSGDFRYRFDLQDRSANSAAADLQNARSRYRARLNVDKDLFYSDASDRPLAHIHFQLSTAPYNNALTNDTDFSGFGTKAPFSLAEAYADFMPLKGLTLRIGRTQEIFADNRQFIWDDDVRFNGFHETYHLGGKNGFFVEFRGGQYILSNPNVQIVPPPPAANSIFLTAGYALGQRVPSPDLFDQGVVVGSNLGKKWRMDLQAGYSTVREANQIQLASVAGTGFVANPVLGATLIGNLTQVGNATTTPGGAIYFAGFDVIHYGGNLYYSGKDWKGHTFPFVLFLQGTHNKATRIQNNGYMLGASIGQAAKMGDVQFQYAYFYKPANAFVSQFTDDDVGTGTGVNIKDNTIRVNFGITRWLAWENRLFIQHGIARNNPAINFFVPLPQGYNTVFRYQSHLAFTF